MTEAIFVISVLLFGVGVGLRMAGKGETKPRPPKKDLHPVKYHEMDLPIKKINVN